MRLELRTEGAAETADLAARLAELAEPGDLLLLVGDLGAGKTTFARAYGRALGVTGPVTSPTFTLVNEHEGRLRLYHLDLYRLDDPAEMEDLGLAELLDEDAAVLIEWAEKAASLLPAEHLEVRLEPGDGDDQRRLTLVGSGERWQRVWPELSAVAASEGDR